MKLSNVLDADDYRLTNVADATDDADAPSFLQVRRRSIQLPFSYGDATPSPISPAVPDNCLVVLVELHIEVPFNGVGAALIVGDPAVPARLMLATANDPAAAATYQSHPLYRYVSETTPNLTITPGSGATQGKGLLTMTIEVPDF